MESLERWKACNGALEHYKFAFGSLEPNESMPWRLGAQDPLGASILGFLLYLNICLWKFFDAQRFSFLGAYLYEEYNTSGKFVIPYKKYNQFFISLNI